MILCYVFFEEPAKSGTGSTQSTRLTDQSIVAEVIGEMKRLPVLATLLAYCAATFLYLAFFSYISILVVELIDSTSGQVGLIVGLYSLTYGLSGSQAGRLTVRTNGLIRPLVGANISMAVGFTLIGMLPSIYTVIIGCVIFGLGAGITASLYRSLLITFSSDTSRGSLVSIMESSGRLAQTASPIFFGVFVSFLTPILGYQYSLQVVWISLGLATTGIALVCLFVVYSYGES
jgi:MFS family permease